MGHPNHTRALRVSVIYIILTAIWITFSDRLLALVMQDVEQYSLFQTFKGLLFITVTAGLIFLLLQRELRRQDRVLTIVQAIIESSPVAIINVDADGTVKLWNAAAERIFGWSRTEVIGHMLPYLPPEKMSEFEALHTRVMQGESLHGVETQQRRKDGQEIVVSISTAPVRDTHGRVIGIIAAVDDITARKAAETEIRALNAELEQRVIERTAQLAHAKERTEAIFNSSTDVTILCRTNGCVERVNPAFGAALGCNPDTARNQPLSSLVIPAHEHTIRQAFAGVLETHKPQRLEVTIQCAPHTTFDADVVLFPIVEQGDHLLGVVCSLRDITARKEMESQLRVMLKQAMELNELKSHYVSMAAHDLRNPLAVIRSSIDLLQTYGARLSDEQKHAKFDRITDSIGVMVELLDDILTLGIVESGNLVFEPAPLDVIAFCEQIIEEIQHAVDAARRIAFTSSGQCDHVQLDAKLLRHILGNLLSNAIKYSSDDSVITFEVECAPDEIAFCIQDQGIGIPEADQKRLFEAFYRADNARQRPGTGLGLAIVKQSVELHRGTITWESAEGRGTTFTVTLPTNLQAQGT